VQRDGFGIAIFEESCGFTRRQRSMKKRRARKSFENIWRDFEELDTNRHLSLKRSPPIARSGNHKIWHIEKDLAKRAERALREVPSCFRNVSAEKKETITIQEFRSRNKMLRIQLERTLDEISYKAFKSISSQYRDTSMSPENYVRTAYMKMKVSKELLLEVILLLPKADATRQKRAIGTLNNL